MKLGTFGQKDESQRDIRRRLTEEKRRFLTSPIINDYYKNQINIIWEEKCLEKIKQKINDYNNNNIIFSSKNDLSLRVKQELIGIEDNVYQNNQIINELNSTWNSINDKVKNKITDTLNSIR